VIARDDVHSPSAQAANDSERATLIRIEHEDFLHAASSGLAGDDHF
jgi:hypothetical protein